MPMGEPRTDDELLPYVVEADFEDTVSRIILRCVSETGWIGVGQLVWFLKGQRLNGLIKFKPARASFGRLKQLTPDQIRDFISSLVRLSMLNKEPYAAYYRVNISSKGERTLKHNHMIPAQIPWPFPSKQWTVRNIPAED